MHFTSLDRDAQNIIKALLESNKALQGEIGTRFNALSLTIENEHIKTRNIFIDQAEERCRRKAELSLLESLRFETMTHRHDAIPEAHQHTFEWIFRDPDVEGKPWDNFCWWAESGSGVYWITGKADLESRP